MDKKPNTLAEESRASAVRAPYVAPRLQPFGAIGTLTQAGTSGSAEMGMGMGMGQDMRMA